MKIFKSEFLNATESLPELALDEIYKSVAIPLYLKSLYKNIYQSIDDDGTIEYRCVSNSPDEIVFMNRELYVDNDGVKIIRNYFSNLNCNVLSSIKVQLFLNDLIYEKEFHSKDQLIELLNNSKFVQEKWKLVS